jgi:four helix bundle protein
MKNFKTFNIALDFYKSCQKIKVSNRVLRDQFERASLSVVLNISEGYGRLTEKDRRRFYSIAFGSLRETQCLLKILQQEELYLKSDLLSRYLYQLIRSPGCLLIS